MAERSGLGIRIDAATVPLLPAARGHAERGLTFGGLERNTAYYVGEGHVRFSAAIDDATQRLLLDPQTSGGLLVGVPSEHAAAWGRARDAHGVRAWKVGEATAGHGVTVV